MNYLNSGSYEGGHIPDTHHMPAVPEVTYGSIYGPLYATVSSSYAELSEKSSNLTLTLTGGGDEGSGPRSFRSQSGTDGRGASRSCRGEERPGLPRPFSATAARGAPLDRQRDAPGENTNPYVRTRKYGSTCDP